MHFPKQASKYKLPWKTTPWISNEFNVCIVLLLCSNGFSMDLNFPMLFLGFLCSFHGFSMDFHVSFCKFTAALP